MSKSGGQSHGCGSATLARAEWMARIRRENSLALEAPEFADDESGGNDSDWSRYEMLGYESDEETGFLDERGAQVAQGCAE